MGPDNTLVVADGVGHWIQIFQLDGTFIHKFGCLGNEAGELYWPSSVTVDDSGYILVTEMTNSCVSGFDKNYKFVCWIGSAGRGEHQLLSPLGVAISPNSDVYIANKDCCILKFAFIFVDCSYNFITFKIHQEVDKKF